MMMFNRTPNILLNYTELKILYWLSVFWQATRSWWL